MRIGFYSTVKTEKMGKKSDMIYGQLMLDSICAFVCGVRWKGNTSLLCWSSSWSWSCDVSAASPVQQYRTLSKSILLNDKSINISLKRDQFNLIFQLPHRVIADQLFHRIENVKHRVHRTDISSSHLIYATVRSCDGQADIMNGHWAF